MSKIYEGNLNAAGKKFVLVVSRFNSFICDRLVEGATDALVRHGAAAEDIDLVKVPGAFELPAAARRVALCGRYDGVIALGAVIRGATPHFDMVANESAKGIAHVSLEASCAVTNGILTCDTIEQAIERAGTKAGNKGADAALAALEMANLFGALGK